MPSREVCRGVWAALESARRFLSLDDLEELTGIEPFTILQYVELLVRHRYCRAGGIRRAPSGEAIPLFRLVRRSGPEAPYRDELGLWVDPNVKAPLCPLNPALRIGRGTMPSMRARIRYFGDRCKAEFTRQDVRDAIGILEQERHSFDMAWKALRESGELQDGAHDGLYSCVIPDLIHHIRRNMVARIGQEFRLAEFQNEYGEPSIKTIRTVVDLLAAEGFRVTMRRSDRRAIYRIDPPAHQEAAQ